ncbi:MAG: hybrid sensor histidine kinase/response regulator transcription factor [Mucilaginibacter sp.]
MKRHVYAILLAGLFVCWAFAGFAQVKATLQHYSTEDGLSHVIVNCVTRDQQGFMWFGTWDGVNRFDGHQFICYKSFPGDNSPLGNNRIEEIIKGDCDHLWVRAYDRQVYRFDKTSGTFFSLAAIFYKAHQQKFNFNKILLVKGNHLWLQSVNDGLVYFPNTVTLPAQYNQFHQGNQLAYYLPSNKIRFFHQDSKRNIWVGTAKGLAYLTVAGADTDHYVSNPVGRITGEGFNAEVEDASSMFFCTDHGNVYIFNKKTKTFEKKKISDSRINHLLLAGKNKSQIYATDDKGELLTAGKNDLVFRKIAQADEPLHSMYEDKEGNLWIEPDFKGIYRFDVQKQVLKAYHQQTDAKYKLTGNHYHVFEDGRNRVWVSLKKGGFGYYNEKKDSISYFFDDPDNIYRKFSNNIMSLHYDHTGVLWLTTDGKDIEKIVFQGNDFDEHLMESSGKFRSDNEVRGLAVDKNNRIWAGTKAGKLYIQKNGRKVPNILLNAPPGGLGQVYNIRQDSAGTMWLGTKENGLYKADPVNKEATSYRLTHFEADPTKPNSLISNEVYSTATDNQGRVWIGTYEKSVDVQVNVHGAYRFIHLQQLLTGFNQTSFLKVRQLAVDNQGKIWVATTDGLMIINAPADLRNTSVKYYTKITGDKASLGNNDVQYIYKDRHGTMWLATSGGGLSKAISDDPMRSISFKNYTVNDGMANGYIVSLIEGNDGNLWMASQNGLTRFNTSTGQFRNYSSLDGIPKTVFSEASCARTKDDSLFFGTINGMISILPSHVIDYTIKGPMEFTDIQVNNQSIGHNGSAVKLDHELNSIKSLELKYNQNVISFDYAVLDYRAGNQAYVYRLKGFDAAWHNSGGQLRATYTNLPPGRYTFEVKCISNGLYSNVPYKSIDIHILPPLWLSWWAYTIYVILAIAIFFMIRRTAITMLNLRNKIAVEQELAALKMKFFTNVSHELRTPLTLIVNPIAAIADSEKLSPKGQEYIALVQKNTDRMVRFINQLLDLRKIQSGKAELNLANVELIGFINNIGQHFNEIAKEKNIRLKVHSILTNINCQIDAEKLETVIYNILGNAFKFSPVNKSINIRVDANTMQNSISIAVQDEAGGIDETHLRDIFELYYEGNTNHEHKGTGIGLALSKELIELHNGKIMAYNNTAGGLTIAIHIPLVQAAADKKHAEASLIPLPEDNHIDQLVDCTSGKNGTELPLVLLVEDNQDLSTFLKTQLSELYRVEVAYNGIKGLNKAIELMPDLILSDVMMPEMDGIQMLDKLKNDSATSHIPVILLSAKQSVESQIEGLKYGADYYITKPFSNDFLLATINNLIGQRRHIFEQILSGKHRAELSPSDIVITSQDEIFLQRIIKIVEDGMVDPDFNIDDVARSMNMSRSPFYRKFKSLTRLAPVEFIREMRLKRARQYLDAGETSISDISYMVGFNNVKYFSTCFKEHFKKSPTEYIRDHVSKAVTINVHD